MFYEPRKNNHGLPYNPYKSIVVPRPIGWISTISADGSNNLAPYSQFNNLGYDPPFVMFSASQTLAGDRKDTARNIVTTGEFVINVATYDLREAVRITSREVDPTVDEAAMAGLEMTPSTIVKPLRVKASPIQLECVFYTSFFLPGRTPQQTHEIVVGEVVGVHIRDDVLTEDGKVDVLKIRPLARLGYYDYTTVESTFSMFPDGPNLEALRHGLEGRPHGFDSSVALEAK
jgi:flavin reductase (DIM6/NTAB) family NADH-FMN oxidoreductase RutF